jgi:RHH-type proline utilization regulon transcriptional repressor/proline dehydrogenase/delta 1-pyrroline-5-carboxylate dehydrogenase
LSDDFHSNKIAVRVQPDMGGPIEARIQAKGREIFRQLDRDKPTPFSRAWVTGRLMDWSMSNERLKVELFRFIDVLPSLTSAEDIAQHAHEYLTQPGVELPAPMRLVLGGSRHVPWLTAEAARQAVRQMARTFILAETPAEAVPKLREMRELPLAFTADILGETVVSEVEAQETCRRYLELIEVLGTEAAKWGPLPQIDSDGHGPIPAANVSVKISALYSQIAPADSERAIACLCDRLLPLLKQAAETGVFINFDMESSQLKDLTLELFMRLLDHPDLKTSGNFGIALQAYLRETEGDFEGLLSWAKQRGAPITVRLIKGAYWDYETIMAAQRGWPVRVFEAKSETDAAYERLARRMLENETHIRCAFGTHSVRSIAACIAHAEELGLSQKHYEFQMLYGMAEPIKRALIEDQYRLRDYCPIGETLTGMSYLVRRLLENTSNEGFLRAAFVEGADTEHLLRNPETVRVEHDGPAAPPFQNEPHTDFSIKANRERMTDALAKVRTSLGARVPLLIGGREVLTEAEIASVNPTRPDEIIGHVSRATKADAEAALAQARDGFAKWRRTTVEERARCVDKAAELLRRDRFELAALEVFETGKNWIESDADVAEAIDFCNFYAQEMRRIAEYDYLVPGETNLNHYVPRGVAVVIAPWNFPIAILCGMSAAALVAGNPVIMKPSEQSSVCAARLARVFHEAGVPPDVVQFLPGAGEEVGAHLVESAHTAIIAFTGSREVGLKIYEAAGRTAAGQMQLKKVICEMGGKNAAIVDSDADVDEVVPAVVQAAFSYQGQKCSALSRLILLDENHDRVLQRLIEAVRSLQVGAPEDPGSMIGPVIDAEAHQRVLRYIEIGKTESRLAFQGSVPPGAGYFVPPTIFADVKPDARIAQEVIFGPVLAVIRARDLDDAFAIANGTQYALTAGFFSRSPANIERAATELEAGNVYINRPVTGALVARHPFGGYKMSGGGTKAGGRDYLQNFLFPRVVTENRMRRGFADVASAAEGSEGE